MVAVNALFRRRKAARKSSCPALGLLMRTVYTIVFSFLISPLTVAAQNRPASGPPDPPVQSSTGGQNSWSTSDVANMTAPSSSEPVRVPVLVQSAPAFLYLRPIKQTPAAPAGYAPAWNVSAGLSVVTLGLSPSGRAVLGGVNISGSTDTGKRFGGKVDLGYERSSNLNGSGRPMSMFSYLVGPVFYPTNGDSVSMYVHVLLGGARVAGPFRNGTGGFNVGYAHYPAWSFGGGAEYRLSRAFGFRVGVDYLHTHFYDPTGAVRGQNDIRIVSS